MGFMIAPLDLKIEELEIWKLLYSKADYNTMLSKYTKAQLLADASPLLNLTEKKVRLILSNLKEQGYIQEIKRGAKGNPSIFYLDKDGIIKGQLKGNYRATIGQLKGNYNADIAIDTEDTGQLKDNYRADKGQTKGNPINKNIIKEKNKDIYAEVEAVLSYYDSLENLPKYKGLTAMRKSHVKARLDDYGIDEVKRTLELANESKYLNSGNRWFNFDWIFKPSNFIKISEGRYNEDEEELDNVADITQYRYQTPEQRYQNHINALKYDNSDNPFVNRRANNE